MSTRFQRAEGFHSGAEIQVRVTIFADYLCPWCWPPAVRLRELRDRRPGAIELEHRSFLLLPEGASRTFTEYHLEHRRAAWKMSGLPYDLPPVGSPYPTSSLPALSAARWVQHEYPEHFDEFDLSLYDAFFRETADISDPEVLADLAEQVGLPAERLMAAVEDGEFDGRVLAEHEDALALGISAVPTVLIGEEVLVGTVPLEAYEQAVEARLASRSS